MGISLRGDRAKLSRAGETERSARLLAGLGGICGMLLPREGAPEEAFPCSWDLLGLGGTWGVAVDIFVRWIEVVEVDGKCNGLDFLFVSGPVVCYPKE